MCLKSVAECYLVLQRVVAVHSVCCSVLQRIAKYDKTNLGRMCCSLVQNVTVVAVRCSVLQCAASCCQNVKKNVTRICCCVLQCVVAGFCNVLQRAAACHRYKKIDVSAIQCCSVSQCVVAVHCSMLPVKESKCGSNVLWVEMTLRRQQINGSL